MTNGYLCEGWVSRGVSMEESAQDTHRVMQNEAHVALVDAEAECYGGKCVVSI